MKKDIIEYELEDGTPVFVEVEDSGNASGAQRVSRGGRDGAGDQAQTRFTEAVERIRPAAEAVLQSFREMTPG